MLDIINWLRKTTQKYGIERKWPENAEWCMDNSWMVESQLQRLGQHTRRVGCFTVRISYWIYAPLLIESSYSSKNIRMLYIHTDDAY